MQQALFDTDTKTTIEHISNPQAYKGLYSFHKYWGKKPTESIVYFIQKFTNESDVVLDPFLGSGFIGRESLIRERRFIGIDVNPFAIEHTTFLLKLPTPEEYLDAIKRIEKNVKTDILNTYRTQNGKTASHYLWEHKTIKRVWVRPENGRSRLEFEPTPEDYETSQSYEQYKVKNVRDIKFFTNSRINSKKDMSIYNLFTGRALRNIDLLLDEINSYPEAVRRALLLTLTSSSGQMSKMVFAITNRGKTKNQISDKIEVGSWVIGFWRPELHFEINVWNCFESRANKLYKSLQEVEYKTLVVHNNAKSFLDSNRGALLFHDDCVSSMSKLPVGSVKLICTDPPHSDRIPYLELSEMWNGILGKDVSFEKEIIVSNAKERNKNKSSYLDSMKSFITESSRILDDEGMMLIYFNARDKESWKFLEIVKENALLEYIGSFPMEYSATSVVQDNRKGGMKTDYVLVLKKSCSITKRKYEFDQIKGWSTLLPKLECSN